MPRPVKTGSGSPGDIVNLLAVEVVNGLHHVDVLLVVHEEVLMASFDLHPVDVLLGVREVVLYGPILLRDLFLRGSVRLLFGAPPNDSLCL